LKEVKEYQCDQGLIAKTLYNVANTANQALLQAQADFRSLVQVFIDEFKKANIIAAEEILTYNYQAP
jgi:hypothetical protein